MPQLKNVMQMQLSLRGEIEIEVQPLIAAIAKSVREADDFLKNFNDLKHI